jgi:Matrixin
MAAFSEILPLFGVDAAKGFMMVPAGGFNLIYHFLGKGASFADSLGGLSIKDVTDEFRKAPDVSTISKNPKQPLFVDKDDMTAFFHAALQGLSDPSQRLLAVTANTPGVHTVTVKASRRSESLTVWALSKRPTTTFSFRYVKYIGQWPPPGETEKDADRYSKGVKRTKDEGEKYAKLIGQLLLHQANVSVELKSSDDVGLTTPFGPRASNAWFKERLLPNRDKAADRTIFVVPQIDGAEGRSMIDKDPTALMVAENPKVVWVGNAGDPFQLVATHELAHTLGSKHRQEEGLLMSDYYLKQGLLIDKDTLNEINPPSKKP